MSERGTHPLPFFCKCVKRKGFKSFVLKVCETKGVADVFLRKCVKLKSLGSILASFEVSRFFFRSLRGPSFVGPGLTSYRATRGNVPSRRLAITTEVRIAQMTSGCQGLIWEEFLGRIRRTTSKRPTLCWTAQRVGHAARKCTSARI